MPQTSEKWEVRIGRDYFILNEKEIAILRQAMATGKKFVWFKDLCLNTSAIDAIVLTERKSNLPELPLPSAYLSEKEEQLWEEFKKKREELLKKKGVE